MEVSFVEVVVWVIIVFTMGAFTGAAISILVLNRVIKKLVDEDKQKKQETAEEEDWWKYGKTPPWVFEEEES